MSSRPPPPPTWEALHRAAEVFDVDVVHARGAVLSSVRLRSKLGAHVGQDLAAALVEDLPDEDADRVLRAMAAAALVQLGPGRPVALAQLEAATAELGLTLTEAGELADLAEALAATDPSPLPPAADRAQRAALRLVLADEGEG